SPNFRYALLMLPGPTGVAYPPVTSPGGGGDPITAVVYFNTGTADTLSNAIASQQLVLATTKEPYYSLDILWSAVGGQIGMDWNPAARHIVVMFTGDESEGTLFFPGSGIPITNANIDSLYQNPTK